MAGVEVTVRELRIGYHTRGGGVFTALDLPALDVAAGGALAVTGPSGSGKTSLLYALSGLERPAGGHVRVGDTEVSALPEGRRDRWRRRTVGFIFQDFHLFPGLDALGNVLLPARFDRFAPDPATRERGRALLDRVGIRDPHQPVETLSRGEMQRVAVARALLFGPPLLLADEPTASLDAATAAGIAGLLLEVCAEAGSTLIAVTHDAALAGRLGRELRLVAGRPAEPLAA